MRIRTLSVLVAVLFPAAALAEAPWITEEDAKSAATVLKKSDDAVNSAATDQEYTTRMTLRSGNTVDKVIEMRIQQKGLKRIARFLKPGDVKGMAVLVESPDISYVYLPQFNKSRRIAAHTAKQSFMGTDFTEQEMNIVRYDAIFDPALAGKEGDEYVLKLTPKPGKDFSFAYIKMWIDANTGLQNKVEYYSSDNVKVKTQERSDLKVLDGVKTQTKAVMTDHMRNHSTSIDILGTRQNIGLTDDVFTVRNLEWGR